MSDINTLQKGIERVRQFRHSVRNGSAWAVLASLIIIALLLNMGLDVLTDMGRLERGITLALICILAVWAFRKFVTPVLGIEESDIEVACMIERKHGLESDLVAALQFADADRAQFGSSDLREAALANSTKISSRLNYLEGFSRDELTHRSILLVVCIIAAFAVMVDFPDHTKAFLNRLFLGNAHYPTKTRIVDVVYPGDYAPFGLPLTFEIHANGVLPESGKITLKTVPSGLTTQVEITPDPEDPNTYRGKLERAAEDFSYQVYLGDAYTHPKKVTLTPLPVIDIAFNVETPEYAKAAFAEVQAMHRGVIALEGSRIIPTITSDKALKSATITVDEEPVELAQEGDTFTLKGSAHPLQYVTDTLRWSVQVVDQEGLSLEQPMAGVLQVRPDQPPGIGIASSTRLIWSGAAPTIQYKAIDDYGLARIDAYVSLQRWQDGIAAAPSERKLEVVASTDFPVEREGEYSLNLSSFNLQKGDRLLVSFETTDHRGDLLGQATRSEPLILEVSDREGVIEALRDLDAELERKLDQIINAQLGIGEAP